MRIWVRMCRGEERRGVVELGGGRRRGIFGGVGEGRGGEVGGGWWWVIAGVFGAVVGTSRVQRRRYQIASSALIKKSVNQNFYDGVLKT